MTCGSEMVGLSSLMLLPRSSPDHCLVHSLVLNMFHSTIASSSSSLCLACLSFACFPSLSPLLLPLSTHSQLRTLLLSEMAYRGLFPILTSPQSTSYTSSISYSVFSACPELACVSTIDSVTQCCPYLPPLTGHGRFGMST